VPERIDGSVPLRFPKSIVPSLLSRVSVCCTLSECKRAYRSEVAARHHPAEGDSTKRKRETITFTIQTNPNLTFPTLLYSTSVHRSRHRRLQQRKVVKVNVELWDCTCSQQRLGGSAKNQVEKGKHQPKDPLNFQTCITWQQIVDTLHTKTNCLARYVHALYWSRAWAAK
jgi:hypothetical protein